MNAILIRLLPLILSIISPEIKQVIRDFVQTLEDKAKKTVNPWDNMFVALLKRIINID